MRLPAPADGTGDGSRESRPASGPRAGARGAAGSGERTLPPAPRADCAADAAGTLTFTLALRTGGSPWRTVLLQRRGGESPVDTVHLPLTEEVPGVLSAQLPLALHLAEGRWDVYAAPAGTGRTRLRPGVYDLRTLAGGAAAAGHFAGAAVCVPYTTKYGNLSLRTWLREPHAEAGAIHLAGRTGTVEGRLHGAELAGGARLEVRARGASGPAHALPVTRDGQDFTAALALGALPAPADGPARFELWLRPDDAAPPVRVARLLDDVPDKRAVFRYPAVALGDGREAAFVYTADNDLDVEVRAAVAPAA
ncbi:hypothetical protein V1J52_12240 [Streptomyces sp. TRM 70351]|uniref:hypothetical protein n=1 Tax=Streptomyces sp. TRM 70351 TaxID=3116552 RepID=UPI002E7B03FD|nr:hypothetical protein [Streptomyces sp. TRM 70351]MEE1928935.1 hypothetical protein [Streptomyces sp. TRM 70351]